MAVGDTLNDFEVDNNIQNYQEDIINIINWVVAWNYYSIMFKALFFGGENNCDMADWLQDIGTFCIYFRENYEFVR